MSENSHWAEDILLILERNLELEQEVDKNVKVIVEELRSYFNENSTTGNIPVSLDKIGTVSNVKWIITIGDVPIEFGLKLIKQAQSKALGKEALISDDKASVMKAIKFVITSGFPFNE